MFSTVQWALIMAIRLHVSEIRTTCILINRLSTKTALQRNNTLIHELKLYFLNNITLQNKLVFATRHFYLFKTNNNKQ